MKIDKAHPRLVAMVLTAFAVVGLVTPAHAYDVYHGLQADPDTGAVIWTNVSFGVSGGPVPPPPNPPPIPNLSFFYFNGDIAAQGALPFACILKVHLANTGLHPAPNAQDAVGNAAVAIGIPSLPFPWAIVFDNQPAGHWNITKGAMVDITVPPPPPVPNNAAAGTVAATGFHALATNPGNNYGVTVIDGMLHNNCHA